MLIPVFCLLKPVLHGKFGFNRQKTDKANKIFEITDSVINRKHLRILNDAKDSRQLPMARISTLNLQVIASIVLL